MMMTMTVTAVMMMPTVKMTMMIAMMPFQLLLEVVKITKKEIRRIIVVIPWQPAFVPCRKSQLPTRAARRGSPAYFLIVMTTWRFGSSPSE